MSIEIYGLKAFRSELLGVIRDLRVTWLMEELGLPYRHIVMDPTKEENKTEAYLKLNPTGKVPTLVDNGFAIFESAAICEYLAGKNSRFIPSAGTNEYYLFKQWVYFVLTNIEPQTGRVFSADFFMEKDATREWVRNTATTQLARFLTIVNQRLKDREFIFDDFTICDIFLITNLVSIQHTTILNDYPEVQKYFQRCTQRPAYVKASGENGKGPS